MKRPLGVLNVLPLLLFFSPAVLAAADDGNMQARSALDIVPSDAAFFASWSRQGEQIDILRESKAFRQLLEIPQARQALGPLLLGEFDSDNPDHVTMRQWLSQPFVQVGLDALSHEVFVCGGASFTSLVNQSQEMAAETQRARLEALSSGKTAEQADEVASLVALRLLGKLRVPDVVVGLKTENSLRARSQLMLLDGLIHMALASEDVPPWMRKCYGRETIQGRQFLTFELEGSMIPLEKVEFQKNTSPKVVAAFKAAMRQQKLTVAAGFLGDYAIFSIGNATDHLRQFADAQGKKLADHPDFARVAELGDRRFTSIRYVASDYRTALDAATAGQLAGLTRFIKQSAENGESLTEETLAKVEEALAALQEEKQENRKPRSALLGYTCLTDDGYEGFGYGEPRLAAPPTGPMSVLLHVGADPIGVAAQRTWIGAADDYARFSDQVAATLEKIDEAVNVEGEANEPRMLAQYYFGMTRQIDTILRQKIVPALVGGQIAVVLSATDRSRQWHPEMPVAKNPLPLPELGLVVETNDPQMLMEGIDDAYQVVKDALPSPTVDEGELPPLEPKVEDVAAGRLYFLPMWPELTRIDPNLLAPTAGLADHWLVLSLRPKTAETLLEPTGWSPPEAGSQPDMLVGVTHLRPAALLQLALDWIDYAEQVSPEELGEEDAMILAVYRNAIQLAGCLKSYTRTVCDDGDSTVTHTVWRFEDRP